MRRSSRPAAIRHPRHHRCRRHCLPGRCLDSIVADIPDGDWFNNEGGYGNVTLYPQETDEDLRVECDMTYGEEDDDQDFEDDEEFIASDFNDTGPENSGDAIAVDDSTLQPAKGNIP